MNGSGISIAVVFYRYSEESYEMSTMTTPSKSYKIIQLAWTNKKYINRNMHLLLVLEYKPGIVMYAKFIDGEYILAYVFY